MMKALIKMVLGKQNVMPVAGNRNASPSIEFAANKLREKLAEKRLREEKLASQYGRNS
jgi:hypothetical protein